MNFETFDELYYRISKIIELVEKVPQEMRNEVFKRLFEVATDSKESSSFSEEILSISNNGSELKNFIVSKKPVSNIERSLLFVYYLSQKGIKNISHKHIAKCYEICELNEPGNLIQNLRDACSSRYGYLENIQNHFYVTPKGLAFCEN